MLVFIQIVVNQPLLSIAVKLAQICKYRLRLHERERRKRLAGEYGLTAAGIPSISKAAKTPHSKKKSGKTGRQANVALVVMLCWVWKRHICHAMLIIREGHFCHITYILYFIENYKRDWNLFPSFILELNIKCYSVISKVSLFPFSLFWFSCIFQYLYSNSFHLVNSH